MEIQGRCFPRKSIVINALYDTIEALGLRLDSSDSEMGTLIVSDVGRTGSMHIALDNSVHSRYTGNPPSERSKHNCF